MTVRSFAFASALLLSSGLLVPAAEPPSAFPTKLILDLRKPSPDGPGLVRFRREGLTSVESIEGRVAALLAEKP